MMEPSGGRCFEPLGHLADDSTDDGCSQRGSLNQNGQTVTVHVLTDDEPDFTVATNVENPDEPGIIDQCRSTGGVRDVGCEGVPRAHHADRDPAVEGGIDGTPECSVAVALNPFFQPVTAC